MLKRISIHNYNCFVDFELELPRMSLLVGSNGSGKTSLWEVLAGLQDVIVRSADVKDAFPTRSLTRWRKDERAQRFGLTLQGERGTYRYELEIAHDVKRRTSAIHREELRRGKTTLHKTLAGKVVVQNGKVLKSRLDFNRKFSYVAAVEASGTNEHLIDFREALANLWLLSPSPRRMDPTTQAEDHWLDRDGGNFASWWRGVMVEDLEAGPRLLDALRPAMPGLRNITFERISSEVRELMLSFRADGVDYKLSASELSDGQRALLLLHGFLHGALRRRAMVFIDEPETGLAPHEMQPWISAMSQAIDDHRGQALVASHHPEIIDYVASAHTIQFRRPGGGPATTEEVTLETTHNERVSEWLSRPWAYDDDLDEGTAEAHEEEEE